MNQELPLANIITLGVSDVAGERDFYRRLGCPLVLDTEEFVVFELRGALLALFGAATWVGMLTPRRNADVEPSAVRSSLASTGLRMWTS